MQTNVLYHDNTTRVVNHVDVKACKSNPDFVRNVIDWIRDTGNVKSLVIYDENHKVIGRWSNYLK